MKKWNTKKMAIASMMVAIAMIVSYIENLFFLFPALPGIKPGLANIIILSCMIFLTPLQTLLILCTRIGLSALLFGNLFSGLYSLAGGLCSYIIMLILHKSRHFSVPIISMFGGISHNIGQLLVASVIVKSTDIFYLFPYFILAGILCGLFVGILTSYLVPYLRRHFI